MRCLPGSSRVSKRLRTVWLAAGLASCVLAVPQVSPARERPAPHPSPTPAGLSIRPLARTDAPARSADATSSTALSPDEIRTAYGLPATGIRGGTVAIVSAYDDPQLDTDLAAYDKRFHLPTCSTSNGCVRKLNQDGTSSPLPPTDSFTDQWLTESSLGTEIVHGICQSCRILLVEADSADEASFSKAAHAAADAGATAVVTTFTGVESPQDGTFSSDYTSPHAAFVAAVGDPGSGDYGYSGDLNFPAVLPNVLAVGGTELKLGSGGQDVGESAWKGTVSGCSLYQTNPPWQASIDQQTDCGPKRVDADLAAVADPGAIVHVAGAVEAGGPWYVANGTSLSAPVIGAIIGLAGSAGAGEAQMLYRRAQTDPGAFHDIISGMTAPICKTLICRAGKGWDGPTGLGSPAGLEAFLPAGAKLTAAHPRISIAVTKGQLRPNRSWNGSVQLANANAFRMSGSVVLRRTLRIKGRKQTITFATGPFALASLASGSTTLTITRSQRQLLRSSHNLTVYVFVRARAAFGPQVTVERKLMLVAP